MSRILKFRAFGNYADMGEGMHYDIIHNYNYHHELSGRDGENWGLVECLKWMKVMQWTGLFDKNGKEIYEGDIIYREITSRDDPVYGFYGDLGVVEYINSAFYVKFPDGEIILVSEILNFDIHVKGNIYENPELLVSKTNLLEQKPPSTKRCQP